MIGLLDRLNLRPNERRLVVVVGLIFFIMINVWLVRPHFSDWSKTKLELQKARDTLAQYQMDVAKTNDYNKRLRVLEGQGGRVASAQQGLNLAIAISAQAQLNGVRVTRSAEAPPSGSNKTNQFFEEKARSVDFDTGDSELVNFLYALGTGDSMIRVKNLSVKPDLAGNRLVGSAKFVASYQRQFIEPPVKSLGGTSNRLAGAKSMTGAKGATGVSPLGRPIPTVAGSPAKPNPVPTRQASEANRATPGNFASGSYSNGNRVPLPSPRIRTATPTNNGTARPTKKP